MYGILSKGLHELSEDECKTYFPVLRTAIEIILDEKIALKERDAKLTANRSAISAIAGRVKGGGSGI
jgi:hypothetical protein